MGAQPHNKSKETSTSTSAAEIAGTGAASGVQPDPTSADQAPGLHAHHQLRPTEVLHRTFHLPGHLQPSPWTRLVRLLSRPLKRGSHSLHCQNWGLQGLMCGEISPYRKCTYY